MKPAVLILFFTTIGVVRAQYAVSFGLVRHQENLGSTRNESGFLKPSLNYYNGLVIQGEKQTQPFRVYTELGYIRSKFDWNHQYYHSFGLGESTSKDRRNYHSNIKFQSISMKLGLGRVFDSKKRSNIWLSFSPNLFFEYDRLLKFKEQDRVIYKTTSYSQVYNGSNIQSTTEHPPSYPSGEFVFFASNIIRFGTDVKLRVNSTKYFLELSATLAMSTPSRVYYSYLIPFSEGEQIYNSPWNLGTSIKLGYIFPKKEK